MDKVSDTPTRKADFITLLNANAEIDMLRQSTSVWYEIAANRLRELAEQKEHYRVLTDEMLVMMDERNAAVKDAERYRWLRDNRLTGGFRGLLFAQAMGWKPDNMDAQQVDTAIDAAIRAMKKEVD